MARSAPKAWVNIGKIGYTEIKPPAAVRLGDDRIIECKDLRSPPVLSPSLGDGLPL